MHPWKSIVNYMRSYALVYVCAVLAYRCHDVEVAALLGVTPTPNLNPPMTTKNKKTTLIDTCIQIHHTNLWTHSFLLFFFSLSPPFFIQNSLGIPAFSSLSHVIVLVTHQQRRYCFVLFFCLFCVFVSPCAMLTLMYDQCLYLTAILATGF